MLAYRLVKSPPITLGLPLLLSLHPAVKQRLEAEVGPAPSLHSFPVAEESPLALPLQLVPLASRESLKCLETEGVLARLSPTSLSPASFSLKVGAKHDQCGSLQRKGKGSSRGLLMQ